MVKMKLEVRMTFNSNKIIGTFLVLFLTTALVLGVKARAYWGGVDFNSDGEPYNAYTPIVDKARHWTDCSQSRFGSTLITMAEFNDSTGPELVSLAQDGYTGLAAATTYYTALEYFPSLVGWDKAHMCNSHECLRTRISNSIRDGLEYRYLGYDPERLPGVPPEEKYNLPWATQQAHQIADDAGKELMISYSTTQLHQEADERGFGWDNPGEMVALLAPYGDMWLIQAADEYNNPYENPEHPDPILSQRHFPPGPDWRAEVERWVNWIKAANPDIEIWIQLALHRIPAGAPPWEDNYPSAELVLEYRQWLVDPEYGPPLVDGVYLSSVYSWAIDPIVADQEMEEAIRWACGQGEITLVEEGWTDDLSIPCNPNGECLTILPGYYYRIYENSRYPCGSEGNHQFMVLDHGTDTSTPKHLFAKFLGGGMGFWYYDSSGNRVYFPHERAEGILRASQNWYMFFRTSVSEEFANGVTKRFRDNSDFRILVPSYCSHDLYHGRGEYNDIDGFGRWGYLAAMEAVDYVQQYFNTEKIITYGGSAGAAGSFNIGKDQDNVVAIIMDSFSSDLSAIRDGCWECDEYDRRKNVFGGSYPCFCPDPCPPKTCCFGDISCMEVLAPRIGFHFGADEPFKFLEQGFNKPIYLVWNERDASLFAHLLYENLHNAIEQYNPGGNSVANKVCITDPESPPGPICNLHVPSAYDYPETIPLVEEIYNWALSLTGNFVGHEVYLPLVVKQ